MSSYKFIRRPRLLQLQIHWNSLLFQKDATSKPLCFLAGQECKCASPQQAQMPPEAKPEIQPCPLSLKQTLKITAFWDVFLRELLKFIGHTR
jgi:hypothetical protein